MRVDNIGKCRVFENVGVNIISPTKLTVSAACAALEEEATEAAEIRSAEEAGMAEEEAEEEAAEPASDEDEI